MIGASADPRMVEETLRISTLEVRRRHRWSRGVVRCFYSVRGGLQSTASFTKKAEARFRTQLLIWYRKKIQRKMLLPKEERSKDSLSIYWTKDSMMWAVVHRFQFSRFFFCRGRSSSLKTKPVRVSRAKHLRAWSTDAAT